MSENLNSEALVITKPLKHDIENCERWLKYGDITPNVFDIAVWKDREGLFGWLQYPVDEGNWQNIRPSRASEGSLLTPKDWEELQSYLQAGGQWWYFEYAGRYARFGGLILLLNQEIKARTRFLWYRTSRVLPPLTNWELQVFKRQLERGIITPDEYKYRIWEKRTPPYGSFKFQVTDANWQELAQYLTLDDWEDMKTWMKEGDAWWYWEVKIPLAGGAGMFLIRNNEIVERTAVFWKA